MTHKDTMKSVACRRQYDGGHVCFINSLNCNEAVGILQELLKYRLFILWIYPQVRYYYQKELQNFNNTFYIINYCFENK